VVSTYALARRDEGLFKDVEWSSIILDEAQNIKNPLTGQAKAVRSFNAGHRIALTGHARREQAIRSFGPSWSS